MNNQLTAAELIASIEGSIGVLASIYRAGADESDLYEASLFAVALGAARSAGGNYILTNNGSSRAHEILFRRSPGNLGVSGNRFTHALVRFPQSAKRLEIHLGVKVVGTSGVAHECDIALLDSNEADRSRALNVDPRSRGLIVAIEAKNYSAPPGLGVGRAFLGLATELSQKKCNLVYPSASSDNVRVLLSRKMSECFDELSPRSVAADRLRSHLDQKIRNWIS